MWSTAAYTSCYLQYFHPDHMSSEEKMKLELQRVRDEFKMSENDCGSARVQSKYFALFFLCPYQTAGVLLVKDVATFMRKWEILKTVLVLNQSFFNVFIHFGPFKVALYIYTETVRVLVHIIYTEALLEFYLMLILYLYELTFQLCQSLVYFSAWGL